MQGLQEIVPHFEHPDIAQKTDLRTWKYDIGKNDRPIELTSDHLSKQLDEHFDKSLQRWLAACAVYPELHWDLTLRIGQAKTKAVTLNLSAGCIALTTIHLLSLL